MRRERLTEGRRRTVAPLRPPPGIAPGEDLDHRPRRGRHQHRRDERRGERLDETAGEQATSCTGFGGAPGEHEAEQLRHEDGGHRPAEQRQCGLGIEARLVWEE
jgi:hypothetical protein